MVKRLLKRMKKRTQEKREDESPRKDKITHSNWKMENERAAQHLGYMVAVSGLSAKLAKSDGHISKEEVASFRALLSHIEEETCEVFFNEAALDSAGFEHYARRMKAYFREDAAFLKKTLSSLVDFAAADGPINLEEILVLHKVSGIFGVSEKHFIGLLGAHILPKKRDPYQMLGIKRRAPAKEIKKAYHKALMAYHPDKLQSLASAELAAMAHERITAIKDAYESISKRRRLH
jgi:DnaJ like chaperone protein